MRDVRVVGMSEKFPFISVVVPAYNEEGFLPLCLGSLKGQDYAGDYEIIVVDNASTDRTAEVASRLGVKVVFEARRSPSFARHRGLLEAKGEIVAFIDADTIARQGWLSAIVRRFSRNPRIVAVTGPCAFFDAGVAARIMSHIMNFLIIILDHAFRWVTMKGGALWGSNFAARRQILLEVGGFDTSIKFLGEDNELSLRLKVKGKLSLIPSLFVLTSARRLREEGIWCALWNYIISYFSVLFCHRPLSERLTDIPWKLRKAVVNKLLTSPFAFAYGRVIAHGDRCHRQIALTFDDGPNEPFTSQTLDILRQYGVKATFFMIGQNVEQWTEVCQRVIREGHIIGNHSYFHSRWLAFNRGRNIARELKLAQEAIYQASGVTPSLFRPPYGLRSPWLLTAAANLGFTVITWDNMTNDWDSGKGAEQIASAILTRAKPGSIIVLHDGRGIKHGFDRTSLLGALPHLLAGLKQQGYQFVTVPELIASKGYRAK